MPHLQVRDVSPETHEVLRRRAAEQGKSLQEYLSALLDAAAARPTVEEVLRRAGEQATSTLGPNRAAAILRAERDER